MRLAFAAGALGLSLLGIAGQSSPLPAPVPPARPGSSTPSAALPAASAASAAATAPATTAASDSSGTLGSEAAAKHAKRTACLKEAKLKKLVGADKTSFLKTCIAAP